MLELVIIIIVNLCVAAYMVSQEYSSWAVLSALAFGSLYAAWAIGLFLFISPFYVMIHVWDWVMNTLNGRR